MLPRLFLVSFVPLWLNRFVEELDAMTARIELPCFTLQACLAVALAARSLAAGEVQFNRDVRPILSDKCFACHGPDQAQRKAELRLDREAVAKGDLNGSHPIVAGKPVST